jgi:signal transduction histidine kinase
MTLARQMILTTTATLAVAGAIAGASLLWLERAHLTARVGHETRIIATSVEISVENALRDHQVPDVAELLARLEQLAGRMDVLVYDLQGRLVAASDGAAPVPEEEGEVLASVGDELVVQFFGGGWAPRRVVVGLPVREHDGGPRYGTLLVSRPLDSLDKDVRTTATAVAAASAGFTLVTAAVIAYVLRRRSTGPVERLALATSRLAGDLDAPLEVPGGRDDELGTLGRVVLELQSALRRARDGRAAEVEHRERLERDLRAADKLIAIGQLASGVAHEIGSPLQVLVGRARLLAESSQDPAVVRQARTIAEQGDRITRIVERMQDLVRRRPPRRQRVDLGAEVDKVVRFMGHEVGRRGVRLGWRRPTSSPELLADPDEVQQVALNLVLNAVQATPHGGTVEVDVRDDGPTTDLVVRDTGVGIEAERLPRIFDAFHTSRGAEGGTGLGLAVVRSIVERYAGQVDVDSTVGAGTTFVVRWPKGEPT